MKLSFKRESKVEDLRAEMKRRMTTRASMLRMFKQKRELTTGDLNAHFGTGCSSRLFELRKEGHKIVATYERPGCFRYTYLGERKSES